MNTMLELIVEQLKEMRSVVNTDQGDRWQPHHWELDTGEAMSGDHRHWGIWTSPGQTSSQDRPKESWADVCFANGIRREHSHREVGVSMADSGVAHSEDLGVHCQHHGRVHPVYLLCISVHGAPCATLRLGREEVLVREANDPFRALGSTPSYAVLPLAWGSVDGDCSFPWFLWD
jgi:hypothetical protein